MKKEPTYNSVVFEGIILVLMWISDRILYPEGGWPIIRVAQYILMTGLLVMMIIQFVKISKANNKK